MSTERGYTLLEVLIAVTILGIAAGLLFATFSSGLSSYKKGETRNLLMEQARSGLRMLSADLEGALPLADRQEISEHSLSFVTLAQSPDSPLVQVGYRFEEGRLVRSANPLATGEKSVEEKQMVVMEDLQRVKFRSRINGQWQDAEAEHELPQSEPPDALEVQLTLSRRQEEVRFETVFHLPLLHVRESDVLAKP